MGHQKVGEGETVEAGRSDGDHKSNLSYTELPGLLVSREAGKWNSLKTIANLTANVCQ
jgi:hypothetical protein